MDNTNRFPKTQYTKLKDETHYNCSGTCCTCRFLSDRSNYDAMQYAIYEQNKQVYLPILNNPDMKKIWKS